MNWLWRLLKREHLEAQLDAELRDHIERQVADYVAAGMSAAEARRRVGVQFGGVEQVKELCRDARGTRWLEELLHDLRYGVRMLRKSPSFTAAAIVSLALGIGANTAIFTLIDAILLKPLPVHEPHRLVELLTDRGNGDAGNAFSFQALQQFRAGATTVDLIASHQSSFFVESPHASPELATGQYVTSDYFRALGVRAAHGRTIEPADDRSGAPPAIVLGDAYWRNRFASDRSVIGGTLTLDGQPFTIVGIAPAAFRGLVVARDVDFWLPLSAEPLIRKPSWTSSPGYKWLQLVGRVRNGYDTDAARAELEALFATAVIEAEVAGRPGAPRANVRRWRLVLESARSGLGMVRHQYGEPLVILLAISGLVLLIACVNVANLLLARATTRRHEMAVRLSLGAWRPRVIRQLITESAMLALAGAAGGIALAYASCRSFVAAFATTRTPMAIDVSPDLRILVFTTLLALTTVLVFGFAPAWRTATVVSPARALQSGSRTPGGRDRRALSRVLVTAQVALSVVMLFCGGLFLRSLHNIRSIERGFESHGVLIVSSDASRAGLEADVLRGVYHDTIARLGAIPGVRSASVSQVTPIWGGGTELPVVIEPFGRNARQEVPSVYMNWVTPGYFATMGTPIRSGRDFTWRDAPASPKVIIVNQTMARRHFGTDAPIGGRITLNDTSFEIVGVVADSKYLDLRESTPPTAYFHWMQQPDELLVMQNVRLGQFAIRAEVPPRSVEAAVRESMRQALPSMRVTNVSTLQEQVNASIVRERMLSSLSAGFATLGLLLSAIGLYGVMAYTTSRRTNEIGIRMALGAQTGQIAGMVVREALVLTVAGVAVGIVIAYLLSGTLAALLFGLTPTDTGTTVGVALLMVSTGLAAAYVPARRAAGVQPAIAVRAE